MIAEGDTVHNFDLPASSHARGRPFQLDRALDHGSVLLAYCPSRRLEESAFDGALAFVPWFQFMDDVTVLVVTSDGRADPDRLAKEFEGLSICADVESTVSSVLDVEPTEGSVQDRTHLVLIAPSRTVTFSHRGGTEFGSWKARDLQRRIDRTRPSETRRTIA